MGKMSRDKGKRGELEVAALLRDYDFEAERGQQYRGGPDSPDVRHSIPGIHIEVKRTEKLALYEAMGQAEAELPPKSDKMPVVFHRRNGKPWAVIMRAEDFLALMASCETKSDTYGR